MRKKQDIMWEQSTLWESVEKWVTKYLNADKHSPASSARSGLRMSVLLAITLFFIDEYTKIRI